MRSEFLGTYRGCRKGETLGANPEDYPQAGADLLSGRMKAALQKFRSRLNERPNRRRALLALATGGMIRPKIRKRRQAQNITYARAKKINPYFLPAYTGIVNRATIRSKAQARSV